MAHPVVEETVYGFLNENWTGVPWEGPNGPMAESQGGGQTFFVVQFPYSTSSRVSVTTEHYREDGGIRFVLFVQRAMGTDEARDTMRELHDLFIDRRIGNVRCGVPDSPFMDDTNDEGLYFQTAMVVPYWFTFSKED